jgi:Protein of unknown function (DUF1553)/Protein of unknown function (DUF1549)/Planctomycete cytochrome C
MMAAFRPIRLLALLLVLLGFDRALLADDPKPTAEQLEFFEKDVRPLLVKHCYECHSVNAKRVEAKLLLDSRDGHVRGGDSGPAFVPGKADKSLLIDAVRYESYEMPPKGKLSDSEIETFVRWVNMGSPWPDEPAPTVNTDRKEFDLEERKNEFWVWQPIAKANPPEVKDEEWPRNTIDRYVLARLEEAGLSPSHDADTTALLRRLYFDLIGLPPTPEEVEAFLVDCEPTALAAGPLNTSSQKPEASAFGSRQFKAVDKVVNRLLDSPHFGERWGRHWLDLVRYAESRGHEFDNDTPNAFQYRDYVIRALNADVPYDQFVREHIAGDLLRSPRLHPTAKYNESVLGTGFWFLGEWVHSPVDIRKDESDRFDNMLDVMSKTFLGVTVACARCHDHKFDAISTADYYSLSGFLQSSDYRQVPFESMEQNRRLAEQLAKVDDKYRRQISELLESQGIRRPSQTSYLSDEAIVVDFANIPQSKYLQDGVIFGQSPRREGLAYLETEIPAPVSVSGVESESSLSKAAQKRQRKTDAVPPDETSSERAPDDAQPNDSTTTDESTTSDEAVPPNETSEDRSRSQPAIKRDGSQVTIARHGAAVSDLIWSGLESITEGAVANKDAIAKLPKSGRMLRSPTFELKHGNVSCRVDGVGHVVACVDSHRLVAGPLHGETIRPIKEDARWVNLNLSRYVGHRLHLEFVPAEHSQLSVRLITQGLDANGLADLDRRLAAGDKQYDDYATAAEAILNSGNLDSRENNENIEERVFADFESGTYDGWTVTGDAFGKIPQTLETIAPNQGRINGRGKFFVNSYNIREGGEVGKGDKLTGTLTSSEFAIDFDKIEFLIGGGAHAEKTCVNLLVDEKVVLSATGKRNNQMSLNTWDVSPFAGKTANIQVVDNHTGGWGNIGIDHIVFQRRRSSVSIDGTPLAAAANNTNASSSPLNESGGSVVEQGKAIIHAWRTEREKLAAQVVRKSRLAPAMLDGNGEEDRILIRGNSAKPGDVVPRHFLSAISGDSPMPIKSGSGRLELAEQINDPANPLTARVIVNRLWHHLMGRGIVPTVDDFGFLGQRPTHPELLDHLATQFRAEGQSLKRMIKYIVLSRTYQMSSHVETRAREADPNNLLWHHQPPRRLQGEVIRDSLLALSGRLDRTAFGPPVPIHLTSFMDGRGRPKDSGPLDGDGRRSIYIAVRRNFLSPLMLTFDTPVPFSSMGRRNVSNVPAQSLILLNDPLVVELSRKWGERALQNISGNGNDALKQRIDWMYLAGFGRQPTNQEREAAASFLMSQASERSVTTETPDLWASFAHVLVNTKEFIYLR